MKTLQYAPSGKIDDFNNLLSEVCEKHDIISVTSAVVHNTLLLTLTEADDLPISVSPILVQPVVVPFTADMLPSLASLLDVYVGKLAGTSTEEAPRDPAEVRILPRLDDPRAGYAVILLCVGLIEAEGEGP